MCVCVCVCVSFEMHVELMEFFYVGLKIELTESQSEWFDRISYMSADRCVENNGGRCSKLALVLAN